MVASRRGHISMATEKQIEANRLNAQKCTGPRSAEGKAKSSQNALKTGLNAKSEVISTESRDEYETLIAEYYGRYNPATPEERCLVDDLIKSEWLGRRYMAASAAIWEYDFGDTKEQDMGLTFIRRSEVFGRAQRCITATQRNFAHTLKQLRAIQARRATPDAADEVLEPELVSFSSAVPTPRNPAPKTPPFDPPFDPEDENIPPIAA
jgi:hypothetical protein